MNNLLTIGCDIIGKTIDISYPYKQGRIGIKLWGYLDYLSQHGYGIIGFHKNRDYIFRKRQNLKADPNSKRSKRREVNESFNKEY